MQEARGREQLVDPSCVLREPRPPEAGRDLCEVGRRRARLDLGVDCPVRPDRATDPAALGHEGGRMSSDPDPPAGAEAYAGDAKDLPDDHDPCRSEATHGQAADRRLRLCPAGVLQRLRAEVDRRAEVKLADPPERIRLPRRRVAEADFAVPIGRERRRIRRPRSIFPGAAARGQQGTRCEPASADGKGPPPRTRVHTNPLYARAREDDRLERPVRAAGST